MDAEGWWHVATLIGLCLLVVEGVLILGMARVLARIAGRRPPTPGVPIGASVPAILLPSLGDEIPQLIVGDGVARVVLFVSTACPGCAELVPSVQPTVDHGSSRWAVTVVVAGPAQRARTYAETMINRRVRIVLDPDGIADTAFALRRSYPFGFAVGGDGIVRARGFVGSWGFVHKMAAEAALADTLAVQATSGDGVAADRSVATGT